MALFFIPAQFKFVQYEKIRYLMPMRKKQDEKPEQTLTEKWIADLREKREQAIREGRYFDGQERDNILSFDKRKDEKYVDTSPCEYEP